MQDVFRSQRDLVNDEDIFDPNKLMRMPICLCIDNSSSMEKKGKQVRDDISNLLNDICNDEFLNSCVELGIYTFSSKSEKVRGLSTIRETESATLTLSFDKECQQPDLLSCLKMCMVDIERRKSDYRLQSLNSYQPHVIVLGAAKPCTDGNWEELINLVKEKQKKCELSVTSIVIGNKAVDEYKQLSIDGAVYRGLITNLADILKTVKNSMRKLSESSASIYNRLNSVVKAWEDYL